MPSVAGFELPQTPTPGNIAAAKASRRQLRPFTPTPHDAGASSFRQKLSQVSRQSESDRKSPKLDQPDSRSRTARSGTSEKSGRTAGLKGRKQGGGRDHAISESEETESADSESVESSDDANVIEGVEAELPVDVTSTEDETNQVVDADKAETFDGTDASRCDLIIAASQSAASPQVTASQTPAETTAGTDTGDAEPLATRAAAIEASSAGSPAAVGDTTEDSNTGTTTAADDVAVVEPLAGRSIDPTAGQAKKSAGVSPLGARGAGTARPEATGTSAEDGPANAASAGTPASAGMSMMAQFAEAFAPETATARLGDAAAEPAAAHAATANPTPDAASLGQQLKAPTGETATTEATGDAVVPDERTTEARFTAANHVKIASEVRGALMPNGGRMELKLDPPELGALQVSLFVKDGVVTASFQTQNPEAARLLSHSLGDLRQSLEAQGVVVDKLHVQQAPKDENAGNNPNSNDRQNVAQEQQRESRREQQRKDMMQKLWDQLSGNGPIDVTA